MRESAAQCVPTGLLAALLGTALLVVPGTGQADAVDGCTTRSALSRQAPASPAAEQVAAATIAATTGPVPDVPAQPGGDDGDDGDDATSDGDSSGGTDTAALSITADASPQAVELGDQLTIEIVVTNAGPGTDPAVTVSAPMPEGLAILDTPAAYDLGTGEFDIGPMEPGSTITLTIVVQVVSGEAELVAAPTVTGEAMDGLVVDNEACALVDVQPELTDSDASTGGSAEETETIAPPPAATTWTDQSSPADDNEPTEPIASEDTPDPTDSATTAEQSSDGQGPPDATDHPTDRVSSDQPTSTTHEAPAARRTSDSGTRDEATAEATAEATDEATAEATAEATSDTTSGGVDSVRPSVRAPVLLLGSLLLAAGTALVLVGAVRRRRAITSATRR